MSLNKFAHMLDDGWMSPELVANWRYGTRTEAIHRLIVEPIEAGEARPDDYDLEGIAAVTIALDGRGYFCAVEPEEFWTVVKQHAR